MMSLAAELSSQANHWLWRRCQECQRSPHEFI